MNPADRIRKAADEACVRLKSNRAEVQVIVARSYPALGMDAMVPPSYEVIVFGVGPKPMLWSAPELADAAKMAVERLEGVG